jgi:LysM repeat protein
MPASTPSRRVTPWLRALAIGVVPIAFLASCGDDDAASGTTLQEIQPTSYVVREPATTTTTVPPSGTAEDGTSPVEQQYTVVAGDAVYSIATRYGVDPVELANYNKWTEGINHPINVGDVVLIPPGAKVPSAATETETETTSDEGTESTTAPDETTAATLGDNCKAGEYVIVSGDTPLRVAEKFDVTVDQLNAANASTPGYGGFVVGITIVIPEKTC